MRIYTDKQIARDPNTGISEYVEAEVAGQLYEALKNLLRDSESPIDAATTGYFMRDAHAALAKARGEG